MKNRKYLPTLSELIDRLSIAQLKEVFISEHKEEYAHEISDILHDIDLTLKEKDATIDSDTIRAIVVLSQMNLHIWHNESNYRKGIKDGNNLELTHGLNGIRNTAKNKIQEILGGRKDYKIDCLAAEFKDWEISWSAKMKNEMTFSEYYEYYLTLHQNVWTRRLHVLGQITTIAYVIFACKTSFWLLLLAPFVVYPFAWSGHYFFEKNKPAAFSSPLWAKLSDWVMFKDWILGE